MDVMTAIRALIQQQLNTILNELYAAASQIHSVATGLGLPSPVNLGDPPGRAAGGPVRAGGAYVVGEAGPELFVPGSSGQIIPNHAMTNQGMSITGGTFHVHGVQDVASLYDALQKVARQRGV
jgi:phage-related minor tail protein